MKKLLLFCFIAFGVSLSVNAQSAKIKKHAAAQAEKKAKEDALQDRKKQLDLDAQKVKTAAKKQTVKTTLASEEIISN
jgi:hypothetical protein